MKKLMFIFMTIFFVGLNSSKVDAVFTSEASFSSNFIKTATTAELLEYTITDIQYKERGTVLANLNLHNKINNSIPIEIKALNIVTSQNSFSLSPNSSETIKLELVVPNGQFEKVNNNLQLIGFSGGYINDAITLELDEKILVYAEEVEEVLPEISQTKDGAISSDGEFNEVTNNEASTNAPYLNEEKLSLEKLSSTEQETESTNSEIAEIDQDNEIVKEQEETLLLSSVSLDDRGSDEAEKPSCSFGDVTKGSNEGINSEEIDEKILEEEAKTGDCIGEEPEKVEEEQQNTKTEALEESAIRESKATITEDSELKEPSELEKNELNKELPGSK
ncbi:hypothetical protein [Bacillus sp. FJAT-45037]|uniref:hypothetical protein n=1 Tax=Bacillus sp. FJAT-45037 TaxID=2011007 RepID=UPI000C248138|nr:hypothetical protein [Bacillus sp. FJAT-45037]